jgi:hypothetical protein
VYSLYRGNRWSGGLRWSVTNYGTPGKKGVEKTTEAKSQISTQNTASVQSIASKWFRRFISHGSDAGRGLIKQARDLHCRSSVRCGKLCKML